MYSPADPAREPLHYPRGARRRSDPGDFYGLGHNGIRIGEALNGDPRGKFLVSLKFGALRDPHAVGQVRLQSAAADCQLSRRSRRTGGRITAADPCADCTGHKQER
jgi:hypothetical protein